jgi:predicted dehydrogenase
MGNFHSNSELTNIAIIGVGRWGINLLRNFLQHPQCTVKAIADPRQERLQYCLEHFDLNPNQINLVTDWSQIRQQPHLDAVVIATPASTHYPLIKDALDLGYHVLAEKPLTLEPKECQELTQLAEKQQKQLLIDHTYLFHPAVIAGKKALESGSVGKYLYGYASRTHLGPIRQDVDVLWDLAIHDLAIFNYWLGEMPNQVQAQGKIWLQPQLPDLMWVNLTYPSGFQAFIHLCWLNHDKQRRLAVVGTEGTLIFDELSANPLTLQQGYLTQEQNYYVPQGQSQQIITVKNTEPLREVCDRFLTSINLPVDKSSGILATQLVTLLKSLSLSWQNQGEIINIGE